jgi:hypothetical protein
MRARTSATFKLSKRTKTMLALMKFKNDQDRHAFKNAMIDAQLAASIVPRSEKRDRNAPRSQGSSYVTNDTGTASTSV